MEVPKSLVAHRHASWLELFFDLVFVASIGVISHGLSHTHNGHVSLTQLTQFIL
jgi:low temperature requirement protein LtrA